MGARGNSGVITSQIFRGMAEGLGGKSRFNGLDLAHALSRGRPDRVRRGRQAGRGHDPDGHPRVGRSRREGCRARQRHRDRPGGDARRRREVGRADAEPAGDPARGRRRRFGRAGPLPPVPGRAAPSRRRGAGRCRARTLARRRGRQAVDPGRPRRRGLRLRDDVPAPAERLAAASTSTPSATTSRSIGESVLVAGDGRALKVHVHNERPDLVIGYGLSVGALSRISVENLDNQARDVRETRAAAFTERARRAAAPSAARRGTGAAPAAARRSRRPCGVVAVAAGDGLAAIFRDFGVAAVVQGGQSANPSTGELLEAIGDVDAREIIAPARTTRTSSSPPARSPR